jgi:hypothetical protein
MRTTLHTAIVAVLLLGSGAPAAAQQAQAEPAAVDARWTAWLGCWQQLEETTRDSNLVEPGTRDAVPTTGVVVCVTPAANPAGVVLSTIVEKQAAFEETVIADGSTRAIEEPGCTGSQTAQWAKSGRRVFARAKLSCADGTTRTISGITTMAPGPVWVDIQVVESQGAESIRVRRYRRSPDQSQVASRLTQDQLSRARVAASQLARSLSFEELQEASAHVTPSTLEAMLIESQARFPLNAKRLVELDRAGVPDRVLDLMIAMSFADKFVVERRTPSGPGSTGIAGGPDLWWIDTAYDVFPYHYAPFAYGMWGRYDYYYYGAPVYTVGVVSPTPDPRPSVEGRVIDGMGYTRVRSREPQPVNMAGYSGSGGGGGSSTSSSGGSSSGGVTSQGYSGGGGGDGGRTAVPRPPQ